MMGKKQFEVLNWAFSFLKEHKREENVAHLLMKHFTEADSNTYYLNMREVIPETVIEAFSNAIKVHVKTGKPVQHMLGYETFYGRNFQVSEDTLIPRPETEELVDLIIKSYPQDEKLTFCDLGTGTGVIAITLAAHFKNAVVYATDISQEALEVAQLNAEKHDVKVNFLQGNFLAPLLERQIAIDIIVSNPPYIAYSERDALADTVRDFDPELALFAKDEGLSAYKTIVQQVQACEIPPESIYFEVGSTQGQQVAKIIKEKINYQTEQIEDINGNMRIVIGRGV